MIKAYQDLNHGELSRLEELVALCILSEEGAAKFNFQFYVMSGDHVVWGSHFNWSHNFAASIARRFLDTYLKQKRER